MDETEATKVAAMAYAIADDFADFPNGALSLFIAIFPEHEAVARRVWDNSEAVAIWGVDSFDRIVTHSKEEFDQRYGEYIFDGWEAHFEEALKGGSP